MPLACDIPVFDRRNFDVEIDSIEQGTGDALSITLHLKRAAAAFPFQVAEISARTGMQATPHMSIIHSAAAICNLSNAVKTSFV